jgi:hypothetical protein
MPSETSGTVAASGKAELYAQLLDKQVLDPARRAGYDLPVVGTSPAPEGLVTWKAPTERWWIFASHRDDPVAAEAGGLVVPPDVYSRLTELLKHGFAPDIVVVGHEMPGRWSPGDPLPEADRKRESSAQTAATAAAACARSDAARQVSRGAIKVGWTLAQAGAALAIGVGSLLAELAVSVALDPIVLAGVRVPDSDLVIWVEVARWQA